MAYGHKDARLSVTKALPNGAASTNSDGIDLGVGTAGDFVAGCELLVEAPALVVGDLANAATMTYDVEHSDDDSTYVTLFDNALVQTGAGGVGAAADSVRRRLPTDVKRYVRVKSTNSGAGDASDKSVNVSLVF